MTIETLTWIAEEGVVETSEEVEVETEMAIEAVEAAETAMTASGAEVVEEMTTPTKEATTEEATIEEATTEEIETMGEMVEMTIEETMVEMTEETMVETIEMMIEETTATTIETTTETIEVVKEESDILEMITLKIGIEEARMVEAKTLTNLLTMNFACSDLKTRIDIITRKRYTPTFFTFLFLCIYR